MMRSKLCPALAALVFTCAAPAQSPSNAGWFEVLKLPKAEVLVRARVVSVDGQPSLQFRNDAREQIHFHFGVNGGDPFANPRVHLSPRKRSALLPLPEGAASPALKLALVRVGLDEGEVLPD